MKRNEPPNGLPICAVCGGPFRRPDGDTASCEFCPVIRPDEIPNLRLLPVRLAVV